MLLVKNHVGPSKINGIGVFVDENIKARTIIWKFNPQFDLVFSKKEVDKLSKLSQEFIKTYAPLSILTDNYILSVDNSRFTNHSSKPNLDSIVAEGEIEKIAIANRDIEKGEELTVNYRTIDSVDAISEKEYLNK